MAKNKSRKLFATTATAALVASALVPAASAAELKDANQFKDWYKDAVNYLVDSGAIQGDEKGNFNPNKDLTRAEAATILAKVLEKAGKIKIDETKKASFSDAENHWSSAAVAALQAYNKDIINGYEDGTFRPNEKITREQLAKIVVTAFDLKANEKADVNFVDNTTPWAKDAVFTLASLGIVEGKSANKFDPKANVTRAEAAVFVHRTEVEEVRKQVKEKEEAEAKIVSVEVANLKEIKITFNKEVDITNATFDVVPVKTGTTIYTAGNAKLSKDKKVVTLTTNSTMTNGDYYNVSAKDIVVKDLKDPITPYAGSVKADDKTAPAIKEVTAKTNATVTRSIEVEFTEPVSFGVVKIGDDIVTSSNPSGDQKTYVFTLANSDAKDLEAGKSYTLSITGLADLAGNYAANPLTQTVTIVRDDVKPTFTLKAINPKQFDIVFDKEMSSTVAFDSVVVKDSNDVVLTQANLVTRDADDKKVFHVTLANSPIASDKSSAEISVTVKGLQDTVGNTVTTKTEKLTLSKETVKPELTAVRVVPGQNNKLELTFSEKVTGIDSTDFVLTNSKDKTVALSTFSNATTDSNNKIEITTVSALANDTYNFAIKVDSVTDASGNKNAAKSFKFTYSGATVSPLAATIDPDFDGSATPAVLDSTQANRKVLVKFNQADVVNDIDNKTGDYKAGAAENPANYTINGVALPEGTKVTFNDASTVSGGVGDTVLIDFSAITDEKKLPDVLKKGGDDLIVTVANVKTEAGATIPYTSAKLTVVDKTAPVLESAFLTGDSTNGYKLTAVFSEKLSAADKAEFALAAGSAPITLDSANVVDGNKVEFAITTDKATVAANISSAFTLKTAGSITNTKDTATTPNTLTVNTTGITVVKYAN